MGVIGTQQTVLNYSELEAAIAGMSDEEAQDYVNKNAIWSEPRLLYEQINQVCPELLANSEKFGHLVQ
jgi:hypothetical protein